MCGEGDSAVDVPETTDDVEVVKSKCDDIFKQAGKMSPMLRKGRILKRQACYLPVLDVPSSSGPLIGETNVENLFLCSGHSCWGINNAPGSGKIMSELLLDGRATSANISSLDPSLYFDASVLVSDDEDEDDEDDETLAERLEKLSGGSQRHSALGKKKLRKHTAGTLTVVLSQALRNNDHSLLETVLANRDPSIVQNTISRLDPSLAIILLDRLAERVTRQQQRFDQMNFWLKWIIIIHGGVLSSMPNLNNKLASLHAVLTKKASTLPRLLELQGRLNMIEQQSSLKKRDLEWIQHPERLRRCRH